MVNTQRVFTCSFFTDLQIVFFVRIESRIESALRFVVESNLRIKYLIHRYFVFVMNESDVRTTELQTEYLFISIQS